MKINTFRWLGLGLAALLASCAAATDTTPTPAPVTIQAPTALFLDSGITTYVDGTTPAGQKGMIQDMGGGTAADVSAIPAKGTFASYPNYWDGGIGWLMKPTGSAGFYDLSSVKTIRFKIKSATILPTQLAFFIQWKSATAGAGGEYTLPLDGLGVSSLTGWNQVSIDVSSGGKIPDTITAARYGYTIENFFTGTGNTHVDTPFAIKWYGSAGTSPNTGPLTNGKDYVIGDIRFLKADGTDANIVSGITWPVVTVPTTLAAAPTVAAGSVISLYNSSATYTDITGVTWNPSWGQSGSISDVTVAGKVVKHLNLVNYQGVDFAGNVQDVTGKTMLHISYWTHNGVPLKVYAVNAAGPGGSYAADTNAGVASGALTADAWTDLEITLPTTGFHPNIQQLKFDTGTGDFYLDNIYFH